MDIFGVIFIADWFLIISLLGVAFYIWSTWHFNFFKDQNIPGPKPIPLFGNTFSMFTDGFMKMMKDRYRKYGKIFGSFEGRNPRYVIADEEMLSEILVKHFWNFSDRRDISDGSEILESFLTVLKGERWKHVRNLMTPTFSSGKLKLMINQMKKCASQLTDNIQERQTFETKEISGCYTMDVIGATSFGIEVNSLKNTDQKFVQMAKKAFTASIFNPILLIVFFFPFLLPLLKKLNIRFMDKAVLDFFTEVVTEILDSRKSSKDEGRTDFIQLMVNAHNSNEDEDHIKKDIEEIGATFEKSSNQEGLKKTEIVAQGVLFFLAGYDTTATTMTLLLYHLAIQPDIQDTLYNSIIDVVGHKDFSYNDIAKMEYLDMCINETLRMYPLGFILERVCNKDITIKNIHFRKDDVITIPVIGIHFDEEKWHQPEVFDPERFTAEAKKARGPFDFMPFGYGPRACIGMRLALLELKIAVVTIVRRLKLVPCDKTQIPLKFDKIGFRVKEGVWIKALAREESSQ